MAITALDEMLIKFWPNALVFQSSSNQDHCLPNDKKLFEKEEIHNLFFWGKISELNNKTFWLQWKVKLLFKFIMFCKIYCDEIYFIKTSKTHPAFFLKALYPIDASRRVVLPLVRTRLPSQVLTATVTTVKFTLFWKGTLFHLCPVASFFFYHLSTTKCCKDHDFGR